MEFSETPHGDAGGSATASTFKHEKVGPGWLSHAALMRYASEILTDPEGRKVELPSDLRVQFCWKCKISTVRWRELDRHMRSAIRPHILNGLVAERSPFTEGAGPCLCLNCGNKYKGRK